VAKWLVADLRPVYLSTRRRSTSFGGNCVPLNIYSSAGDEEVRRHTAAKISAQQASVPQLLLILPQFESEPEDRLPCQIPVGRSSSTSPTHCSAYARFEQVGVGGTPGANGMSVMTIPASAADIPCHARKETRVSSAISGLTGARFHPDSKRQRPRTGRNRLEHRKLQPLGTATNSNMASFHQQHTPARAPASPAPACLPRNAL
jgi:hypothetical protein